MVHAKAAKLSQRVQSSLIFRKQYACLPVFNLMKGVKKAHLPEKTCPVCNRPFSWRKKWEHCWAEVRYCSDRCRRDRGQIPINQ